MTLLQSLVNLASVMAASAGQLPFRKAGLDTRAPGSWMRWRVVLTVPCAAVIYVLATVFWIGLLRTMPLTRLCALMGLSFALVPDFGHDVFDEPVSLGSWVGADLVIVGLGMTARFG